MRRRAAGRCKQDGTRAPEEREEGAGCAGRAGRTGGDSLRVLLELEGLHVEVRALLCGIGRGGAGVRVLGFGLRAEAAETRGALGSQRGAPGMMTKGSTPQLGCMETLPDCCWRSQVRGRKAPPKPGAQPTVLVPLQDLHMSQRRVALGWGGGGGRVRGAEAGLSGSQEGRCGARISCAGGGGS